MCFCLEFILCTEKSVSCTQSQPKVLQFKCLVARLTSKWIEWIMKSYHQNLSMIVRDKTLPNLWCQNYTKLVYIIGSRHFYTQFSWMLDVIIIFNNLWTLDEIWECLCTSDMNWYADIFSHLFIRPGLSLYFKCSKSVISSNISIH